MEHEGDIFDVTFAINPVELAHAKCPTGKNGQEKRSRHPSIPIRTVHIAVVYNWVLCMCGNALAPMDSSKSKSVNGTLYIIFLLIIHHAGDIRAGNKFGNVHFPCWCHPSVWEKVVTLTTPRMRKAAVKTQRHETNGQWIGISETWVKWYMALAISDFFPQPSPGILYRHTIGWYLWHLPCTVRNNHEILTIQF